MNRAQRHAAARNGLAAMFVSASLQAVTAFADGPPQSPLILPLMTAIAMARAATSPSGHAANTRSNGDVLGLLPQQLHIPDGYKIDADDYAMRKRDVVPVDADTIVAIDLVRKPKRGWMPSVAYRDESRGPLGSGATIIRLLVEKKF
jgi:hypothetical protein